MKTNLNVNSQPSKPHKNYSDNSTNVAEMTLTHSNRDTALVTLHPSVF